MKLSAALATPFSSATEEVTVKLTEEDSVHFIVSASSISSLFLLQDTIEHAVAANDADPVTGFRSALIDTLVDVVVSSDLEHDDGTPLELTYEGLADVDTRTVLQIFQLLGRGLETAPFVQAQLKRSAKQQSKGPRSKKR